LLAAVKIAAGKEPSTPAPKSKQASETRLIGAHFKLTVHRALLMVRAKQEIPKNMAQLLGEAINDLCAKYGVPQPYKGEE